MSLRMMNQHNPISRHVLERQICPTSYVHCDIYQFLHVRIPMDDNYWESLVPEATRVETVSVQIPTLNLLIGSVDNMPCLVCNSFLLSERPLPEAQHVGLNRAFYSMAVRLALLQLPLLSTGNRNSRMSIRMRLEATSTRTVSYEGYEDMVRRAVEESMESQTFAPAIQSSNESLEKVKFSGSEDEKCSICLEDFNLGAQLCRLPCSHFYHEDCIVPWLERSNTCPLCRFPLPRHQV